jgi:hypothetical protein
MANGYNPYEFVNFGRYGSAQNMFNENMSFGSQNFYDYDGDGLLDNFPVNPQTTASGGAGSGAGGRAGSGADIFNLQKIPTLPPQQLSVNLGGPDLEMRTPPPPPTTSGPGFGSRFASNLGSPQAMMGIASGIGGIFQGLFGRTRRRNEQIAAKEKYDDMMEMYQRLDTSNLYEDVENQFLNMENPMEDLTVNQKQAEFERQMFQQQQANIMQGLQGAAGGSGIAALAQAMANQGLIQAQRASASIGMQESRNQMAAAQQAARIQMAERAGAAQADQLRLAGAERARGLEYQKVGTELGMAQQELAARNRAIAQADAALYGGLGSLVGTFATAGLGAIK